MSTEFTFPLTSGAGGGSGAVEPGEPRLAKRRFIDATTGDYELDAGRPRNDDTVRPKVLLALRMRRGTCPVLPRFGSRLHLLRKILPDTPRLAAAYVREALKHLVDAGELRDLEVTATVIGTHTKGLHLVASYRDRAGESKSISYTHRMG